MAEFTVSNFHTVSDNVLPSLVYIFRTHNAFVKERESILRILSNVGSANPTDFSLIPLFQDEIHDVDLMSEFDCEETAGTVGEEDRCTEVIFDTTYLHFRF